jgi:hypothetical protein
MPPAASSVKRNPREQMLVQVALSAKAMLSCWVAMAAKAAPEARSVARSNIAIGTVALGAIVMAMTEGRWRQMNKTHKLYALLVGGALTASASPCVAIQCDGDFQIVNGQPISTPYCRDGNLGAVARRHGVRVSDEAIRRNPARKEEICRFVGSDIEARTACLDVLPDGGRR